MIRNKLTLTLLISPLLLSGCTGLGLATGAAAITGISAAQEGGIPGAIDDAKIKLRINEMWFQNDVEAFSKLSTTIDQGRVLLTGVVQKPEQRVEAVRLAWKVQEVKQVMNEIRVAKSEGVTGFVKDKWITSRLRGSLTLDRSVQSINYSIDTVQGIIYLMGVAQNQAELNRVIETARTISGVKQVVSYVKLAGEPMQGESKAQALAEPTVAAQPITREVTSVPQQAQPIQSQTTPQTEYVPYKPVFDTPVQNTNIKSQPVESIEVPARRIPDDAPSIEDQYYR